jgi:GT2 family glycosyltransferase
LKLSVIIVSYNVYPFLDNCLRSVRQAMQGIDGEIIVVDNASVDRTPQLVKAHFPDVKLIANTDNTGFSKANNQGIAASTGEYVLLLNPDTIVSENTFKTCIIFMDQHEDAGALGVKMIDGSGKFLPESKRGLPTLLASFMKMTGLYRLAPKSGKWNSYYSGNVDENETAKIQVLTGAYMFLRKTVLDKAGLLDENFFMYGEDIDLSYRITQAGYAIYYLPTTNIIHYKGESTKKASLNYLLTFYQAMLIFNQKHPEFKGQQILIHAAIYLHGMARLIKNFFSRSWPVILDCIILYGCYILVSQIWSRYYYENPAYFRPAFYYFNIPFYVVIVSAALFFHGAYDKPYAQRRSWIGFFMGVVMILMIYAFLPINLRTSRMVIVLGSIAFAFFIWLSRSYLFPWRAASGLHSRHFQRRAIIVGGDEEADRIKELINRSSDQIEIIGIVSVADKQNSSNGDLLGSLAQLKDIVRVHNIQEIIFSAQDVPFSVFSGSMSALGTGYRFMLAASTTMNIVGSMSRDTEGESYGLRINFKLSDPTSQRSKRLFDVISSILLIICFPVILIFIQNKGNALSHLFQVLVGRKTWVSYNPADPMINSLPQLYPGILYPAYTDGHPNELIRLEHIHYVYARDYHWTTDFSILTSQLKRIGQKFA